MYGWYLGNKVGRALNSSNEQFSRTPPKQRVVSVTFSSRDEGSSTSSSFPVSSLRVYDITVT